MEVERVLQVHGHRSKRLIKRREKIHRPSRQYPLRIGLNPMSDPLYLVSSLITIESLLPSMLPEQNKVQRYQKSRKRNWK